MGRLRRSRVHKNIKDFKKKCRTRKRTKDLDQIHEDLKEENRTEIRIKSGVKDIDDLPGGGQYYCIHCALVFSAICGGCIQRKTFSEERNSQEAILSHFFSMLTKEELASSARSN